MQYLLSYGALVVPMVLVVVVIMQGVSFIMNTINPARHTEDLRQALENIRRLDLRLVGLMEENRQLRTAILSYAKTLQPTGTASAT